MTLAVMMDRIALKLPWLRITRIKKSRVTSPVNMTSMTVSLAPNTIANSGAVMMAYPKPVTVCKKLDNIKTKKI